MHVKARTTAVVAGSLFFVSVFLVLSVLPLCDLKHYCTCQRYGMNNRLRFLLEPERLKISQVPPINNEFLFLNSMYRKITYFGTVKICPFSTWLDLNITLKYARRHKSCEHGGIFNLREFTNEFVRFHGVT